MKRLLCLVLITTLMTVYLSGCENNKDFSQEVTCEDIMKAAQSVGEVPEAEKIYLNSQKNLDSTLLSLWADGLYLECDEYTLIDDYAIFLCSGSHTYEIAVLKADSEDSISALNGLIERRKETLMLGDKGAYDPRFDMRMQNSVVYNDGLFVIFLVTDYNDASLRAIENLKKK